MKSLYLTAVLAVSSCGMAFATAGGPGSNVDPNDPIAVIINETSTPILSHNGGPYFPAQFNGFDLSGAAIYGLPETVIAGDVLLNEPGIDGNPGILSDVLRFWDNGGGLGNSFSFFSDGEGTGVQDDPADTGLPSPLQRSQVSLVEPADEHVFYQAGSNSYDIQSDSVQTSLVPEPGSIATLGLGCLPFLGFLKKRLFG